MLITKDGYNIYTNGDIYTSQECGTSSFLGGMAYRKIILWIPDIGKNKNSYPEVCSALVHLGYNVHVRDIQVNEHMVEQVASWLHETSYDVCVGVGMGAIVAHALATQYPKKIRGFVFIDFGTRPLWKERITAQVMGTSIRNTQKVCKWAQKRIKKRNLDWNIRQRGSEFDNPTLAMTATILNIRALAYEKQVMDRAIIINFDDHPITGEPLKETDSYASVCQPEDVYLYTPRDWVLIAREIHSFVDPLFLINHSTLQSVPL